MEIFKRVLTDIGSSPLEIRGGAEGLLKELLQLQCINGENRSFIFRGQPNSSWKLIPRAFRLGQIEEFEKEVKNKFPANSYKIWCCNKQFRENVYGWAKQNFDQLIEQNAFRHLCEITFYIMRYNYNFYQIFDPTKRPFQSWAEEKTFHDFFCRNLQNALAFFDLKGNLIKSAAFEEAFINLDESLPQHYGLPTTLLDFTYNPYVSLYFATDKIPTNANHFSVYACRIKDSRNNRLMLKIGDPEIKNPRIINQEGTFICFQMACMFYFNYGRWLSIEDYLADSQGNFELIKYEIPIHYEKPCKEMAENEGKTHKFLFPI